MEDNECICAKRRCKYYRGTDPYTNVKYCKAFYEGIPKEILSGENKHLKVMEGQKRPICFETPNRNIVKPIRRQSMALYRGWGHDNLCSTLRNIYLMSNDREVRFWCRIAIRMAKNQHRALIDYKTMLVENKIGIGSGLHRDNREDWQLRPRSLYRNTIER